MTKSSRENDGSITGSIVSPAHAILNEGNVISSLPSGKSFISSIPAGGLQPLLALPMNVEDNDILHLSKGNLSSTTRERIESISKQKGEHTRLLLNSAGNMRYFGESSPLSLLQECRSIFKAVIGPSNFTDDPKRGLVMDEPTRLRIRDTVPLPNKRLCDILVRSFEKNINDTFYIFDMKYFRSNIVLKAYDDSILLELSKLCLLNFVLAIGCLFSESSHALVRDQCLSHSEFFDSGLIFMRSSDYDGKLWMVEANFLNHFYSQANVLRSSAWVHLGTAIRHAQGLGLHRKIINEKFENPSYVMHRRRLWRSLYICDRIFSIVLGRPLAISDYDWDDSESHIITDNSDENFRIRCQVQLSSISQINSKIVENIYRDGVIDIKRTRSLAVELKLWSLNLPNDLDISHTLEHDLISKDNSNSFILMQVHLSQLYGIMLLFRPFLMHVLLRKLKPSVYGELTHNSLLVYFCKACIKSSFLCVWLINFYLEQVNDRMELFAISNCCLFASGILGVTLLEQKLQNKPDSEYISILSDTLQAASNFLHKDGRFNVTSERWGENVDNMIGTIPNDKLDQSTPNFDSPSGLDKDFESFIKEIILMDNDSEGLKDLANFQQEFIPSDDELLNAMGIHKQELDPSGDLPLNAFLYDYSKNDQLFDKYI